VRRNDRIAPLFALVLGCSTTGTNEPPPGQQETQEPAAAPPLPVVPAAPLVRDPNVAEGWFQKGRLAAGAGDHAAAIDAYGRAIAADPNLGLAYVEKAESHLLFDNDQLAINALLVRAIALLPDNPRAHLRYAEVLRADGDEAGAEREWRSALALRSDLSEARIGLADLLARRGDRAGATAELERVIRERPTSVQARVQLAELLDSSGRTLDAAKQLEAAARAAERSADLYRRAARMYETAGDARTAASLRAIADRLDPPGKIRKLRPLLPSKKKS
jgi:tetratricopeptide (TPR) repeat protein